MWHDMRANEQDQPRLQNVSEKLLSFLPDRHWRCHKVCTNTLPDPNLNPVDQQVIILLADGTTHCWRSWCQPTYNESSAPNVCYTTSYFGKNGTVYNHHRVHSNRWQRKWSIFGTFVFGSSICPDSGRVWSAGRYFWWYPWGYWLHPLRCPLVLILDDLVQVIDGSASRDFLSSLDWIDRKQLNVMNVLHKKNLLTKWTILTTSTFEQHSYVIYSGRVNQLDLTGRMQFALESPSCECRSTKSRTSWCQLDLCSSFIHKTGADNHRYLIVTSNAHLAASTSIKIGLVKYTDQNQNQRAKNLPAPSGHFAGTLRKISGICHFGGEKWKCWFLVSIHADAHP